MQILSGNVLRGTKERGPLMQNKADLWESQGGGDQLIYVHSRTLSSSDALGSEQCEVGSTRFRNVRTYVVLPEIMLQAKGMGTT